MEKRKTATSKEVKARYANKRTAALNIAAQAAGFDSWSKLEKEIIRGKAKVIVSRETILNLPI